jgi:hypothetical protein
MFLAKADTEVSSMLCLVKQAAGTVDNLKLGIYSSAGVLVGATVWGTTATTGLKDLAMTATVTLTGGSLYFLAILIISNGSRVLGRSNVGEPGTQPIVSWTAPNQSDMVADVSTYLGNTQVDRAWVAGR